MPTIPEALAKAEATRWGIALSTNHPDKLRAAIYRELHKCKERGLAMPAFHVTIAPGEVWLRARPNQEVAVA